MDWGFNSALAHTLPHIARVGLSGSREETAWPFDHIVTYAEIDRCLTANQ